MFDIFFSKKERNLGWSTIQIRLPGGWQQCAFGYQNAQVQGHQSCIIWQCH